jgi:hypothetical protein
MNSGLRLSGRVFLAALAVAAVLAGGPAVAQPTIVHGTDVFQTSTTTTAPTVADFSASPIPAGYFCPGSAAFTGQIPLVGTPLITQPPGVAANGDTIVERLTDGVFNSAGVAIMQVQVRALQLASASTLTVHCGSGRPDTHWNVAACLCGNQPVTQIQAKVDQTCGCGHFDGQLNLNVCLTFTEASSGQVLAPIQQAIGLTINHTAWCPKPGLGQPVIANAFIVQDCHTQTSLPPNSNFFPAWTCATQGAGQTCWQLYANLTECHSAYDPANPFHQHCTNPICGRTN